MTEFTVNEVTVFRVATFLNETLLQICLLRNLRILAFFISNTLISNVRLKLAKNQAKAKQHPEAELLLLKKLFSFFIHVITQK